jgi:hypothetical protein
MASTCHRNPCETNTNGDLNTTRRLRLAESVPHRSRSAQNRAISSVVTRRWANVRPAQLAEGEQTIKAGLGDL